MLLEGWKWVIINILCFENGFYVWVNTLFLVLMSCFTYEAQQNQQNECAPSEESDQPGHPPSLCCALNGWLRTQGFFMRTAKTLIRLDGCPSLSESSLGAHSIFWFCHVVAQIFLILMHLQMKRDVWLYNVTNLRQYLMPYTHTG